MIEYSRETGYNGVGKWCDANSYVDIRGYGCLEMGIGERRGEEEWGMI